MLAGAKVKKRGQDTLVLRDDKGNPVWTGAIIRP